MLEGGSKRLNTRFHSRHLTEMFEVAAIRSYFCGLHWIIQPVANSRPTADKGFIFVPVMVGKSCFWPDWKFGLCAILRKGTKVNLFGLNVLSKNYMIT